MKYSKLFGKTSKKISTQVEARSHELLVRAGYIDQVASGIFTLLPLGKKTVVKIENIVRTKLNLTGAQEIFMPVLHPKNYWIKSDRWSSVDILFKIKSRFDNEYALAPTHEEIITPLASKFINSYRDLPLAIYHISQKFRDEPRPKSGILRGKEFTMKDLYSFHKDENDFQKYYKNMIEVYLDIFKCCGLENVKVTEASGGSFSKKNSHEFNVLTDSGEVSLYYCDKCRFAQNKEVAKIKVKQICPVCKKGTIHSGKAIEVGNIFDLQDKFSKSFDLQFTDEKGRKKTCVMGCYGIGISRLLGAIAEVNNDKHGLIWPYNITPYKVCLIDLSNNSSGFSDKIYDALEKAGVQVLYDDRKDTPAGAKFADADLIGIPIRLVISNKTGDKIEWKERTESKISLLKKDEVLRKLTEIYS